MSAPLTHISEERMDTPTDLSLCLRSSMTQLAMLTRVVANVAELLLSTLSRGMPMSMIIFNFVRITEKRSTALATCSMHFGFLTFS
jgi:hypothetical protein